VTLCERRRLRADEVIHEGHDFAATQNVCLWPIATDRILVADRRFRGITDMAGAAAGRTRTRMTQSGHSVLRIVAMQNDAFCWSQIPAVIALL
jgi:hypothetical protein